METSIMEVCCRCFRKKEIIGYCKTTYRVPRYCDECLRALENPVEQMAHQPFLDMMLGVEQ